MAFSKQQLKKFADLIRIDISDEINPAEHKLPRRADIVTDGNIRDAVLANDPDTAGVSRGYFAVPKVMDE